jgi:XTP/dITP diphosphohydrolase
MSRRLVVATRNEHKLEEIQAILKGLSGFNLVSLNEYPQAPEVDEDQDTFIGNAQKKALTIANYTGELTIADDSGLSVDALHGEPGVRSARYAGPGATYTNLCHKLLKNLEHIPAEKRTARFTTVISLAAPEKILFDITGICEGLIINELRGRSGFGYDPVFLYPELNKTFAELTAEEKNTISHRARALRQLPVILEKLS